MRQVRDIVLGLIGGLLGFYLFINAKIYVVAYISLPFLSFLNEKGYKYSDLKLNVSLVFESLLAAGFMGLVLYFLQVLFNIKGTRILMMTAVSIMGGCLVWLISSVSMWPIYRSNVFQAISGVIPPIVLSLATIAPNKVSKNAVGEAAA